MRNVKFLKKDFGTILFSFGISKSVSRRLVSREYEYSSSETETLKHEIMISSKTAVKMLIIFL
jgi:hypothetical protein